MRRQCAGLYGISAATVQRTVKASRVTMLWTDLTLASHGVLQLYNEDINDLLAPENVKLPIHESKESGVYVAGLREDIVVSPEQVLELIQQGEANRHIGATKMNEGSSRSHTVFRMVSLVHEPIVRLYHTCAG